MSKLSTLSCYPEFQKWTEEHFGTRDVICNGPDDDPTLLLVAQVEMGPFKGRLQAFRVKEEEPKWLPNTMAKTSQFIDHGTPGSYGYMLSQLQEVEDIFEFRTVKFGQEEYVVFLMPYSKQ